MTFEFVYKYNRYEACSDKVGIIASSKSIGVCQLCAPNGSRVFMLPEGREYSRLFVCPSVRLSVLPYCADVSFRVLQFDALSWKKGA